MFARDPRGQRASLGQKYSLFCVGLTWRRTCVVGFARLPFAIWIDWVREGLFGTGPSRLQSLNGQRHKILVHPLRPPIYVLNDHVNGLLRGCASGKAYKRTFASALQMSLSVVKRTCRGQRRMSANDPKRTPTMNPLCASLRGKHVINAPVSTLDLGPTGSGETLI